MMRSAFVGLLVGGTLFGGCTGEIREPSVAGTCGAITPGPAPIRRLTRTEYNNTVRDLLGDTTRPADAFAPEEEALGFNNNANNLGVTMLLAEQYMVAAEGIAARATQDLGKLLPCDPAQTGEDACVRQFIETFGKRAWRRPLAAAEVDRVMDVYTWGKTEYDFVTGVQLVMQTMLQSPHFLYRVEWGDAADAGKPVARVTDWEMASRLSYLLWNTMPDDELFAAAEAGRLRSKEQVEAQARRMLADPKARDMVRNFHGQWLLLEKLDTLEKDEAIYPEWSAAIAHDLRAETEAFVEHVIFEGDATVASLLTAPYTFVNARLASYYGLEGGPAGDAFERVDPGPARRAGILGHGSVLAVNAKPNQTSPVHRGKFVRQHLLCQLLPPPPDDIVIEVPQLDPNLTTRERFAEHSTNPACKGCHQLMDPIGFGFENFDGAGRWRSDENGLEIDASGEILASIDADGAFVGVVELSHLLAASDQVHECVATQWFRFGYGRGEAEADGCTMTELKRTFAASGYDVKELLVALTQTEAFLYRPAVVPEGGSQ